MTTSACPKCHDEVTLPPGAPRGAQVRCPWCREEFELSELLDRMPPMLEIVSSPFTQEEDRREFPAGAAADDDFQLSAADNGRRADGSFDFSAGGAATAAAPTVAPRPRTAKTGTVARPRRKEKSAVGEIIKVVIGGVVGLVLAQLILWWLPEPYKRDPADLGPTVGKYVPWIVPAAFRPRSNSAGGEADGSLRTPESSAGGEQLANSGGADSGRNTAGGKSSRADSARALPPPGLGDNLAEEPPLLGGGGLAIPAAPLEVPEPNLSADPGGDLSLDPLTPSTSNAPAESDPATPAEPATVPEPAEATKPQASSDPTTTPEPAATTDPAATVDPSTPAPEKSTEAPDADAFVGVADAPMYVKDEVDAALADAQAADEAVQSSEDAATAETEQQFYTALTELAEKLTYSDPNDPKIDEAAQQSKDLLAQGNLRERAKLLMAHGSARLSAKKEDRPNSGIVLFGRVEAIEKKGALYETRLQMPSGSGPSVIPVFSKNDPQLDSGTMVIVLGTLVDEPEKRLRGYEGELPTVVWMSHATLLNK